MKIAEEILLARMARAEYLIDLLRNKTGGGGGTSITGTGLWHNIAGVLQAAALIGTPGQFLVTNETPDSAFVSISGDVSASTSVPGKLTVTGIQNVAVPAPSGVNTILTYNGSTFVWNPPAAGTSVTGTGLWHNVSGTLQGAALIGTPGQFCVTNETPDAAFVTITGDVAASTAVPGLLTVTGLRGINLPTPTGSNTILTFNAGSFTWTSAPGNTITGTGLWHNISGVLQPAALIGTAGQFVVANTTPDAAFVTITGDVSASTSTPGKLTVIGIQGVAVPTPSGSNTVLEFNGGTFTWAASGATTVTGTGLWHNISGVLQAAALVGTSGQFCVTNNTPDAAFVTITGDVSASTVTPGHLTVTGLQGVAVPTPTGSNTVLQFNTGTFTWATVGGTVSVTGTGLWHNISGVLQAAALIGTAGQFCVTNTTPDAAFVTITGDVSASTSTPGKLTVTGLQGVAVPAPSGSNTVLNFNAGAFTWQPGAFTTVTGTGLWHNISGVLQAAALVGTSGQFCVTNNTPDAAFVTISGDVSASTVTPGLLTVVGIRGVSVPAPSGTNTVLEYNGSTFSWTTAAVTQTVTGTGLWHNISGALQAAALIGTAGQFCVTNTTPDAAFVTITGDVSASTATPGDLTVVGIQGIAVPTPTGTDTVLQFNAGAYTWATVSGGGSFTPGADIFGNGTSSSTNQYVSSISFSSASAGGTVAVNGTNTALNWVTNAISIGQAGVTLIQLKALGSDFIRFGTTPGTTGSIRATANTVVVGVNGNSILQTDTGPATYLGAATQIFFQINGTTEMNLTTSSLTLTPSNFLFAATSGTANITFATAGSGIGATLVVAAQSGAAGTNAGGPLLLQTGVGTGGASAGTMQFFNGNTNTALLTTTAFTLVPLNLLFSAVGGSLTTIGFTSAGTAGGAGLLIRAQSATGSNVGGSLTLQSGAGTSGDGNINFTNGSTSTAILTETSLTLVPPNLLFSSPTPGTAITIGFTGAVTSTGTGGSLTIQGQNGNTSGNGGEIFIQSGTHAGSGPSDGTIAFLCGPTVMAEFYAAGAAFTEAVCSFEVAVGGDPNHSLPFQWASLGSSNIPLVPSGNVTLTAAQYANVMIELTGTIAAGTTSTVTLPTKQGAFWIFDLTNLSFGADSAGTLKFECSTGVTVSVVGSSIPAGQTAVIICQVEGNFLTRAS